MNFLIHQKSPIARGALWMTISAFAYAASIAIIHYLTQELHFMQVVFLRNVFGFLFMLSWLFRNGVKALRTSMIHMHVVRGVMSSLNVWFLFAALWLAPVADVAAITFMMPIVASILAVFFLKEKTTQKRWMTVGLGFVGAIMIIRPGWTGYNPGLLLAFGSVVAGAVVAIFIKILIHRDSADTIAFYLFVSHVVLSFGPGLYFWRSLAFDQLIWCAGLGYLATVVQRNFNKAMGIADATIVLPFNFTRLIWAALLGWIFFSELPDIWTWTGGFVIFIASLLLARKAATKNSAA